jgi:hypothetical protein
MTHRLRVNGTAPLALRVYRERERAASKDNDRRSHTTRTPR